jgi:hypothetical protein
VLEREEITVIHPGAWKGIVLPHRSNVDLLPLGSEFQDILSSASLLGYSYTDLFTYAILFVIDFMLEVIDILLSHKCFPYIE